MRTDTQRFRRTVVSRAAITALAGTAALLASQETLAQQTSLERVEITGSAVRRVDAETALPVTVLKVDELKAQGFTTVEDILHTLSANQASVGTSASVGAATAGGSFADLRGLGRSHTLVLLNGRRIVNQALGGAGDSSAPDLNSIPLAAIDRIEVLRDGASSLYGTDAIGGVINFITKKDFQGGEASAQFTSPQHPGGKSYEASVGFGHGDLDKDKWNVFGFLDYQHQDVLTTPQRPEFAFSNKTSSRGYPATWVQGGTTVTPGAPGCAGQFQAPSTATSCAYYYWNWVDLIPKTERLTGMLKGTIQLAGDHQLGLEYTAAETRTTVNVAPVPEGNLAMYPTEYVNGVDTGVPNPYYPTGANPTLVAKAGQQPGQLKVLWRTIQAGPRVDDNHNFQQRFVASLEGTIAGWDYNTGLSWNHIKSHDDLPSGYVDDAKVGELLASGQVNPFVSPMPSDQAAKVAATASAGTLWNATGETIGWDARVGRELGDWFSSGRKAALALGAEVRHEKYTNLANFDFASKVISSSGYDPNTDNEGARTVYAVYGELNVPVTKTWEVTGSIRYDHYPDFGSTVNPKLSTKFAPSDKLALRGAVTTGFRAPSLYELHSAQTFTNTANNWNDPRNSHLDASGNCVANTGFSTSDVCATQFMALTGGNPNLKPEKSKSATAGFVLQPVPQFDATVDWWWIKLNDTIGALADSTVFGNPGAYASHFVRAPDGSLATDGSQCNTVANPGPQCGYVALLNDNLGGVITDGIDLAANYRLRTGVSNWLFRVSETYVMKYRYQTERNGAWFDNVGVYSNGSPIFRNQWTISANWSMGPWAAGLVNHYKSGYLDADGASNVGSYSTWDLFGSWSPMKQLTLTLGVKNLFDTKPPTTVQDATFQVGFDPRFADPLMRAYYVRAQYKF